MVAENVDQDDELRRFLLPDDVSTLPLSPPSVVETNFVRYYAPDFMKPGNDQYVYRHANGLCVIGLAPTHVALQAEGGVTSVDFNVGKSDRSEFKVSGKRKRNAQHFQQNSILCNVSSGEATYTIRCCVKGSLLEVNSRLIQNPRLLNTSGLNRILLLINDPSIGQLVYDVVCIFRYSVNIWQGNDLRLTEMVT